MPTYKIYDTSFGHQPNMSWHWKSKHDIQWYRGEDYYKTCFFTDFELHRVDSCGHTGQPGEKKIAILVEPPSILNSHYDFIRANHHKFDYVLTYMQDMIAIDPNKFLFYPMAAPWIPVEDRGVHEKSKLLSIVASSKKEAPGHKLRHEIIERFATTIQSAEPTGGVIDRRSRRRMLLNKRRVARETRKETKAFDIFGCGFGPFKHPKTPYLKDYMFSFAIINSKYDDYFTEIVTDCFALGTVPIYWGTPAISKYFNTDGMIMFDSIDEIPGILNSLNKELYDKKMPAIIENFHKANEYLVAEDYMFEKYPFLWN
jgi:hypothetical protein